MGTVEARTELESQQLKFEASGGLASGSSEAWRHGQEEGIALHGCSHSLALRSSAESVFWPVEAPASLAPPSEQRSASGCARSERREVKVSTFSATKGWQRIGRSNTMQQRVQSPERSWKKA
jgi:hypothetical protein